MDVHGYFYYRKAIILDKNRMYELEKLLLNYCNMIDYEAEIENKTIIKFSSITEMLSYENYGEWKIKKLIITGYQNSRLVLKISTGKPCAWGAPIGYINTVECFYKLQSIDEQKSLKEKFMVFFKKATLSYWFWGKIRTIGIVWLLFIMVLPIYFYLKDSFQSTSISSFSTFISIIVGFMLGFILGSFDYFCLGRLMPPVVFSWGEEINNENKKKNIRTNIFWCVLVALVVGISASIITNLFNKGG